MFILLCIFLKAFLVHFLASPVVVHRNDNNNVDINKSNKKNNNNNNNNLLLKDSKWKMTTCLCEVRLATFAYISLNSWDMEHP